MFEYKNVSKIDVMILVMFFERNFELSEVIFENVGTVSLVLSSCS